MTDAGPSPEPPSSPYAVTPASETRSASQISGWTTVSPAHDGSQSPAGSPVPTLPARQSVHGALVVIAVAGAVVLASGSFIAGRLTAPKPSATTTAGATEPGPASGSTPAAALTPGFSATDPAGDAAPHPVEGKVYGPSDITALSIRSDGTYLILTTEYTPSTPMNQLIAETAIRLNADRVPSCKNAVLDSADLLIDYDVTVGVSVAKPGANCGDRYQPTPMSGAATVDGSTVTIKVTLNNLGIRSGQRIVVRASASTRIDDNHTTFIQDRAPDDANGLTGAV